MVKWQVSLLSTPYVQLSTVHVCMCACVCVSERTRESAGLNGDFFLKLSKATHFFHLLSSTGFCFPPLRSYLPGLEPPSASACPLSSPNRSRRLGDGAWFSLSRWAPPQTKWLPAFPSAKDGGRAFVCLPSVRPLTAVECKSGANCICITCHHLAAAACR